MQVIVYKSFPYKNYIIIKLKKNNSPIMSQIQLNQQNTNQHNQQKLKNNQIKQKHKKIHSHH